MFLTLDALKAKQVELSAMIAAYEKQPFKFDKQLSITVPELNEGESWVGFIVNVDGTKSEHIIKLPGEFDGKGTWEEVSAWAKSIGGELIDPVEGSLMFATPSIKDQLKKEAYWTREQRAADSAYAWCQNFENGAQYCIKYSKLCGVAVRRLKIS
jgi:hypothetical protein